MKINNTSCKIVAIAAALLIGIFTTHRAVAQTTIYTTDRGWYDSGGNNTPGNYNYFAGYDPADASIGPLRDFFVFNVPLIGGAQPFTSAFLSLFNPIRPGNGISLSSATSATYQLWAYTGSIPLLDTGAGGTTAYTDLANGANIGSVSFSTANNGTTINVSLNSAGLLALDAAQGGQIAFGGNVPLAEANVTSANYIFGYSNNGFPADGTTALAYTTIAPVPESPTWAMLSVAIVLLAIVRRRFKPLARTS